MNIVLLVCITLLTYSCKALQLAANEPEEPCANALDASISHGNITRMDSSSAYLLPEKKAKDTALTIFWTVGPAGRCCNVQDVIDDQVQALRASNILDHVAAIYVWGQDLDKKENTSVRNHMDVFAKYDDVKKKIQDIPAEEFWARQRRTYEFPTLEALWRFCHAKDDQSRAPNNFVLYMHSKTDAEWRSTMQHFVLNRYTDCVRHLRHGFATCGALLDKRSEGATWPHYRGNFWWARCDYVKLLPSPRPEEFNLWIHGTPFREVPTGRFKAEWWLLGPNAFYKQFETSHKNCWGQPSAFTPSGYSGDRAAPESCATVDPGSALC